MSNKQRKTIIISMILSAVLLMSSCAGISQMLTIYSGRVSMPDCTGVLLSTVNKDLAERGFMNYKSDSGNYLILDESRWVVEEQSVKAGDIIDRYDEVILYVIALADYTGTLKEKPEDPSERIVFSPSTSESASAAGTSESGVIPTTAAPGTSEESTGETSAEEKDYVLDTKLLCFHDPDCEKVGEILDENRQEYHGFRTELLNQGYEACEICEP